MNPFVYTNFVKGRDFCPRPEAKKLKGRLESGHSVALIGPRRTGKTSLIYEGARLAKKKVSYVDFLSVTDERDIAQRLLRGLDGIQSLKRSAIEYLSHIGISFSVDPLTGNTAFSLSGRSADDPDTIDRILRSLVTLLETHPKTVLALDEFQAIKVLPNGKALLALFRSHLQFVQQSVVYSGSIRHELEWVFNDYDSPYYKSVAILDVLPIDRTHFEPFLARRFKKTGRVLVPEVWNYIWDVTEGFPGDVQHLCSAIHDLREAGKIDIKIARAGLETVLKERSSGHSSRFELLPSVQRKVIIAIANQGGREINSGDWIKKAGLSNASSILKAANGLVEKNFLWKEDGEYRFFDPFLKAWLQIQFLR